MANVQSKTCPNNTRKYNIAPKYHKAPYEVSLNFVDWNKCIVPFILFVNDITEYHNIVTKTSEETNTIQEYISKYDTLED